MLAIGKRVCYTIVVIENASVFCRSGKTGVLVSLFYGSGAGCGVFRVRPQVVSVELTKKKREDRYCRRKTAGGKNRMCKHSCGRGNQIRFPRPRVVWRAPQEKGMAVEGMRDAVAYAHNNAGALKRSGSRRFLHDVKSLQNVRAFCPAVRAIIDLRMVLPRKERKTTDFLLWRGDFQSKINNETRRRQDFPA